MLKFIKDKNIKCKTEDRIHTLSIIWFEEGIITTNTFSEFE